MMKLKSILPLAAIVVSVCSTAAFAQLSVQETLRQCGFSADALAAAGCSGVQAALVFDELDEDLAVRTQLEQLHTELNQARAQKLAVLDQLSTPTGSSNVEQLQQQLQTASDSEVAASAAFTMAIDSCSYELTTLLSTDQQARILLVIRDGAESLPEEYRVLDWSDRRLAKLSRALKLESSDSHPLVLEAEASYEVQLARQQIIANRDAVALALSGA